jgi:ubiquinone/menaquinone biosynthesis C-methylase UbiE
MKSRNIFHKFIEFIFDFSFIYDLFQFVVTTKRARELKSDLLVKELNPVLDFGCGTGALAKYFEAKTYVGLDPIQGCIKKARKRNPEHKFVIGDSSKLSEFPASLFTACISWGVLHHLTDEQLTNSLFAIKRILRSHGKFIALEPVSTMNSSRDIKNFFMKFDRGAYIRSAEEYLELFKSVGFHEISIEVREDLVRIPYRQLVLVAHKK